MRFGSVCSGIEAATVAWEALGWEPAWLSEIELFPCAVLAHHYPDVLNLGDMTAIPERISNGEIEAPDVLCGGTPCQAFSVAGKRESLSDDRGNLSLTFCEIANAIDDVRTRSGQQPAIIFWENVPGVLNTKDNAFGCFLAELAGEPEELQPTGKKWSNAGLVLGPKRTIAWRVLDAQYFGVAQRRRRVFVVASARNGFNPAEVLFEFDGVRRDTAPSRKAWQEVADNARGSIEAASFQQNASGELREGSIVGTLNTNSNPSGRNTPMIRLTGFRMTAFGEYADDETASTMKARDYKDATDLVAFNSRQDPVSGEVFGSLDTCSPQAQAISHGPQVRRLTPIECERLMGFQDNYTQIPWAGKPADQCPDGHRYKALGNSWAVPVVRWIGKRIQEHIMKDDHDGAH